MKSMNDYKIWLIDIRDKSVDTNVKMSIQKLYNLLNELESKKEFNNADTRILERLEKLNKNIEVKSLSVKGHVDLCSKEIVNIVAKFYKLVGKNHYQNEWMALGMSLGMSFGIVIWLISNDVVYFPLGMCLGIAIGIAYGSELDKKASNDGRLLIIEQ